MQEADRKQHAIELFQLAYQRQVTGEIDEALQLYSQSIAAYPTAEAYTFRGWTYSFLGDYDQAIAECRKAIEVDPEFGNPYNDIGAYLIEQGQMEEAVPWLEQALKAQRYDAYCYPHFNLGRVFEARRDWRRAGECYRRAYRANSGYRTALAAMKRLAAMWN